MNNFKYVVFAFSFLAFAPAQASLIAFTDQTSWSTASGSISGTENFNAFSTDSSFETTAVAANNMLITGSPSPYNAGITNKIDAAAYAYNGYYNIDGTSYLLADLVETQTMRIDFQNTVSAWGASFAGISDETIYRHTTISVFDSNDILLGILDTSSLTNSDRSFYGFNFDSNELASYMIFQNIAPGRYNDVFGIDNISYVTSAAVPEPSSIALLLAGLFGLTAFRNKKV